jgi:hypothetical protein
MSRIVTIPMDSQPVIGDIVVATIRGKVMSVRIDPLSMNGVEVELALAPHEEARKRFDIPIATIAGGGDT